MFAPNYLLHDVFEVNEEFIKKNKIKAIIFDIDNTLVGFTVKTPPETIVNYINDLKQKGIKVSIASNNNENRVGLFCKDLSIEHISRACKPLPFSLKKLCKRMGVKAKETALVGDQVFTDSLGANLCGMTSVMVDIIDTKETLSFKIKRALEKPIINAKRRKDAKKNG